MGEYPFEAISRRAMIKLVKACLFLIYSRQLKRFDYFDIDYNILPTKADDLERPVLSDLLHIKSNELYKEEDFSKYIQPITTFADKVELELQA